MKYVAILLIFPAMFAVNVFTMIYGWGLNPESWLVIVGAFFLSMILSITLNLIK